jgi:hypothetical protein
VTNLDFSKFHRHNSKIAHRTLNRTCSRYSYVLHKNFILDGMRNENERILKIIEIFLSPRCTALSKIARPYPKHDLDSLMINLLPNFILKYVQPLHRKGTETANKWNFSKCKGHNSVKKMLNRTQN